MAYGVLFFTGQHGVTNGVDRDIFMHHCGYGCIHIDRQIRHSIKRPLSWTIVLICAVCGYSYILVSSYTSHSSTRWSELLVWLEMSDNATQCQAPRAVKNPKNLPVAKFQPTTLTTKRNSDYATTLILGYKDDQIKVIIIRWL